MLGRVVSELTRVVEDSSDLIGSAEAWTTDILFGEWKELSQRRSQSRRLL